MDPYGTAPATETAPSPGGSSGLNGGFLGPLLGILSMAALASKKRKSRSSGGGLISQLMAQSQAEDNAMRENNEWTRRKQLDSAADLIARAVQAGTPLENYESTDLGKLALGNGLPIAGGMAIAKEGMKKGIAGDVMQLAPYGDVSPLANANTQSQIVQALASPEMQEVIRREGLGSAALKLMGDIKTHQGLSTRPDPKGAISGLYDDPSNTLGEIGLGQKGWEGLLQQHDLDKLNTQSANAKALENLQHGHKISELREADRLRGGDGGGDKKNPTATTLRGIVFESLKQVDETLKALGKQDRVEKRDPKTGKVMLGPDFKPLYEAGPDRASLLKEALTSNYKLARAMDLDGKINWGTVDTALGEAFGVQMGQPNGNGNTGSPFGNLPIDPRTGRMAMGGDTLDRIFADLSGKGNRGNLSGLIDTTPTRSGGRDAPPGSSSGGRKGITADKYNSMKSYYQNAPGISDAERQGYLKELESKYYVIQP